MIEDYGFQEAREQLMNRKDEEKLQEITKSLDEAIKQLIDIIENDEPCISIEVKDNLLLPIVSFILIIKGSSYKREQIFG